jgi:hypothetical protein
VSTPEQKPHPEVVYVTAPRYQTGTVTKVVAVVLALLTGGYLLPWAIAVLRDLRTHVSVLLVNLLLGWTIIGWIVALVMSLRKLRADEG